MLPLEQARDAILSRVQPLRSESCPLALALGRFLAQDIVSARDLPAFDNSAMDGYAVRAQDLALASSVNPIALELIGSVPGGQVFAGQLREGQCVRVFTGSALPHGADAVIMQEDTRFDPSQPPRVLMLDRVKPWDNVRLQGEDTRQGDLVLEKGTCLGAGPIGLLAALGCTHVPVGLRPVVGLIATGSELREPGEPLTPGQVFEINRLTLALLATQAGAQPRTYPMVADDLPATRTALQTAFSECDVVVTSGGVSVGEKDLVKAAFAGIGGELSFWRVAMKPGRPFALGTWQDKLLFGLPGNPVSAFVTFLLLVRPALLKYQGARHLDLPTQLAILDEALVNPGDRRHFMRVIVNSKGHARSAGPQASHVLRSLAHANGLVEVPGQSTLPPGTEVTVSSWS